MEGKKWKMKFLTLTKQVIKLRALFYTRYKYRSGIEVYNKIASVLLLYFAHFRGLLVTTNKEFPLIK